MNYHDELEPMHEEATDGGAVATAGFSHGDGAGCLVALGATLEQGHPLRGSLEGGKGGPTKPDSAPPFDSSRCSESDEDGDDSDGDEDNEGVVSGGAHRQVAARVRRMLRECEDTGGEDDEGLEAVQVLVAGKDNVPMQLAAMRFVMEDFEEVHVHPTLTGSWALSLIGHHIDNVEVVETALRCDTCV
jgi:hypothetical protein